MIHPAIPVMCWCAREHKGLYYPPSHSCNVRLGGVQVWGSTGARIIFPAIPVTCIWGMFRCERAQGLALSSQPVETRTRSSSPSWARRKASSWPSRNWKRPSRIWWVTSHSAHKWGPWFDKTPYHHAKIAHVPVDCLCEYFGGWGGKHHTTMQE